jgi:hypothetical protein
MGKVPLSHAVRAIALVEAEGTDEGSRIGVKIEVAVSDFVSGTACRRCAGIPLAARFTE